MSSKYLEWKYRDVAPDRAVTLTKKQRIMNFLYYYKWYIVVGAVLIIIAADLICGALSVGRERADFVVAYVGQAPLPDETVSQLRERLSELAADGGSGENLSVQIKQYPTAANEDDTDAAAYASASKIRLLGDIESGEICFFILDDAETFHKNYGILAASDGSYAENNDSPEYYSITALPALKDTVFGTYTYTVLGKNVEGSSDELLSTLYIARRGRSADAENEGACDTFWKTLTRGASL